MTTAGDIVTFGRFELNFADRVLRLDGKPLAVGGRALAILRVLIERSGAIVSNRELIQRVWPEKAVAEGTLRTHVAQLRRILRRADPNGDYLQNITGRGYRFVTSMSRKGASTSEDGGQAKVARPGEQAFRRCNLPTRTASTLGRANSIVTLVDRFRAQRLVTIVGPGGVGKTTLAISVANTLADKFPERWSQGVCFVDLASIPDEDDVHHALAAAFGITLITSEPLTDLVAFLSGRSMLVLLDNCEHVLDAVAEFSERVLVDAPDVYLLTTSREPLGSLRESVYQLRGLDVPPKSLASARTQLLQYSAIRLFVDRAGAHAVAELGDVDLPRITDICRRLEGNPLAIEIAAAHVELLRPKASAPSLQDELYLLTAGLVTVEPRHRTLRASLDWSYGLLLPLEQSVLRHLSVLPASFNLAQAAGALALKAPDYATLFQCLVSLVRKSLLVADIAADEIRYRMPDLLRAYAREKLREGVRSGRDILSLVGKDEP